MTVVQALRRSEDERALSDSSSLNTDVHGGDVENELLSSVTRSNARHKFDARRRDRLVKRQSPEHRWYAHHSNSDLMRLAGQGSQPAWNELVRRHGRFVWQVAKRNGLRDADAEDVRQVTWQRLIQNIENIRQPDRLLGWLATTARRESIRCSVRAQREVPSDSDQSEHQGSEAMPGADSKLLEATGRAALEQALDRLPEQYQVLLRLLMSDEDLSYAEIARRMRLPIGSIGPMRGRALMILRRSPEVQTCIA